MKVETNIKFKLASLKTRIMGPQRMNTLSRRDTLTPDSFDEGGSKGFNRRNFSLRRMEATRAVSGGTNSPDHLSP